MDITKTTEDGERERLNKEAQANRSVQLVTSTSGMLSVTGGSMMLSNLDRLNPSRKVFGKVLGIAGIVIGAISFGSSYISHRWAKKAEQQIKQIDALASTPIDNGSSFEELHTSRLRQERADSDAAIANNAAMSLLLYRPSRLPSFLLVQM